MRRRLGRHRRVAASTRWQESRRLDGSSAPRHPQASIRKRRYRPRATRDRVVAISLLGSQPQRSLSDWDLSEAPRRRDSPTVRPQREATAVETRVADRHSRGGRSGMSAPEVSSPGGLASDRVPGLGPKDRSRGAIPLRARPPERDLHRGDGYARLTPDRWAIEVTVSGVGRSARRVHRQMDVDRQRYLLAMRCTVFKVRTVVPPVS